MSEPRDPALEHVILGDVDDDANLRVYGDWLATRGHPRGELVALQGEHLDALLAQHPELWGGVDRELVTDVRWRLGFIDRARLAHVRARRDRCKASDIPAMLGTLLDGPGRFLRELVVGLVWFQSNDYAAVTAELAKRGPLPLRSLEYGDFYYEETELNWSAIGDLSALYAAVPHLRHLKLRSGTMKLGTIVLPELRSLTIITGGLDTGSASSIATAQFPRIESLDIMFGSHERDTLSGIAPFAPLLERADLPELRTLAIKNFTFHLELVEALVASPLVAQLKHLDLSLGTLGDREAEAMAAARERFAHLESLDVSANYLTTRGLDALRTIGCPIFSGGIEGPHRRIEVDEHGQRDSEADPDDPEDEGSRYAAVYE